MDMNKYLLKKDELIAVVVDMQERLMVAMDDGEKVTEKARRFVKGMRVAGVPIITLQQYTKGLGATVQPIQEALGADEHIEKDTFCAVRNEEFTKALKDSGKTTVLICGTETHICVQQTSLALLGMGYNVVLIADACGSRDPFDKAIALDRMRGAGITVTTYESVVFEMVDGSKSEGFKEISAIVK